MTHGLTYLPRCDRVVVMSDGRISEIGTYDELLKNDGAFAELVRHYLEEENSDVFEGYTTRDSDMYSPSESLDFLLRRTTCPAARDGTPEGVDASI